MTLLLTEADVQELLPMPRALELVEASFLAQNRGQGLNSARKRLFLPQTSRHYMAAALVEEKCLGMKIYTVGQDGFRFIVLLFDGESGKLLALLEADHLGRIRTGAARAFGRDATRRRAFCRDMSERLKLEVEPAESAEAAARFGDVVITATSSRQPVVRGEWLRPGAHLNAIGANHASRREVDDATLARSSLIAVDSLEQAREESGDLIQGFASLGRGWDEVVELHEIVAGRRPGRPSAEAITLFKSNGIALWDIAVAGYIYQQALEKGKGQALDFGSE